MKKSLSIFLALLLVFSLFATKGFTLKSLAANYDGQCGTNAYWNLDFVTGILTISGTGDMDSYSWSESYAPWVSFRTNIKTVIINEGITSIGNYEFYMCENLSNITLPDSIMSIGDYAFQGCSGLTNITIPNMASKIGLHSFWKCTGLAVINFTDNLTSIGEGAFEGTAWYNNQPDGVVYAGKVAYIYKGTMPDNTTITLNPDTLGIASKAFYWCFGLKTISIPDGVINIGNTAFWACTSLTGIYLPASVKSIGDRVFFECKGLSQIVVDEENEFYTSIDGVLFDKNITTIIQYPTAKTGTIFTIPNSVITIGFGAFDNCSLLTTITIGNQVKTIGIYAFMGCSGLTNIDIPDSVTTIDQVAFGECTNLAGITFSENLTSIWQGAFEGTAWYKNQPDGLVYAGKVAYKYKGTMPDDTILTFRSDTKGIGQEAFYDCTGLKGLAGFPTTLITIGDTAFYGCTGLGGELSIPNSVETIGNYAFAYCEALTGKIIIPDSISYLGEGVFYRCKSLTEIVLPNNISRFGYQLFSYCENLKSVNLPSSLVSIGNQAFYSCKSLTNILIPQGVKNIASNAFAYCDGLTSISVPKSVTTIGTYTFRDDINITIKGFSGSYIEKYASINEIPFEAHYITPANGVSCVTDYNNMFMYGLSSGITLLDGYFEVASGYESELIPTQNGYGTGTVVIIKKDGITVESYNIVIFGDINGSNSISPVDALIALQASANLILFDDLQSFASDVNNDGKVNSIDALMILQYASGLISAF